MEGHEAMSEYALSWNKQTPRLVSGGSDHLVVLWDLADYQSTLFQSKGKSATKWTNKKTLKPRGVYRGHKDTVEDVSFHPTDNGGNIFCSVGDDRSFIVWDARTEKNIAARVDNAHKEDINCVDWNNHDPTSIVSGKYTSSEWRRASRSTVVSISIPPPSFKPVSLSLSRSPLF